MKTFFVMLKRNIKLFFKDKGMFFTSLITPMILLVLYATFLGKIYHDSFVSSLPDVVKVSEKLIDALVGGQLVSSILAVSCVTVSFCSNFLMVQDKANGSVRDLKMSPVSPYVLSMSYYIATLVSTLIICISAFAVCLVYLAIVGWYMTLADILLGLLDIFLLVMFGTALSSVINFFLSTQGQISAVGTVISSGYGFICGAYMPLSQFAEGLRNVISFLPGTYGTSLIRNHCTLGAFNELSNIGLSDETVDAIKDSIDCNLYFFGEKVDMPAMYLILISSVILLVGVYVLLNRLKKRA